MVAIFLFWGSCPPWLPAVRARQGVVILLVRLLFDLARFRAALGVRARAPPAPLFYHSGERDFKVKGATPCGVARAAEKVR